MSRKLVYKPAQTEAQEPECPEREQEGLATPVSHNVTDQTSPVAPQGRNVPRKTAPEGMTGMYRPLKQRVTIRLDADIIEWFKRKASEQDEDRGYQTLINQALRDFMQQE